MGLFSQIENSEAGGARVRCPRGKRRSDRTEHAPTSTRTDEQVPLARSMTCVLVFRVQGLPAHRCMRLSTEEHTVRDTVVQVIREILRIQL
jgi:hypothetical protein